MGMVLLQYRNKLLTAVFVVLVAIVAFFCGRATVTPERAAGVYRMDEQVAALLGQGAASSPPQTAQRENPSALVPTTPPPAPPDAAGNGSGGAAEPAGLSDPSAVMAAAPPGSQSGAAAAEQAPAAMAEPSASAGWQAGRIDINTASLEQLMELPRIGETKAQAIIAYRQENGGFRSAEEIVNVKGIGDKTYESFRDQITASVR